MPGENFPGEGAIRGGGFPGRLNLSQYVQKIALTCAPCLLTAQPRKINCAWRGSFGQLLVTVIVLGHFDERSCRTPTHPFALFHSGLGPVRITQMLRGEYLTTLDQRGKPVSKTKRRTHRRSDGEALRTTGHSGRNADQFHHVNEVLSDSDGNLDTGEVETGKRVQKFVRVRGNPAR